MSATPEQIVAAKAQAEASTKVETAKFAELAKVADDPAQPDLARVRAMVQMVLLQQQTAMKMGGMGSGIRDVIKEATPRLEAFSGNMQAMGASIDAVEAEIGRLYRLEKNLANVCEKLGLPYDMTPKPEG